MLRFRVELTLKDGIPLVHEGIAVGQQGLLFPLHWGFRLLDTTHQSVAPLFQYRHEEHKESCIKAYDAHVVNRGTLTH